MVNVNPNFQNFILFIIHAIRLHQKIGFYFDLSYFEDKQTRADLSKDLRIYFEKFYNISFFSDYIGGFITNYEGNLQRKLKLFSIIVFLNFDYLNPSHRSFFSELKYANIECILISPTYVDTMLLCPYLYINMDLNKLFYLNFFKFYFNISLKFFYKNSWQHNFLGGRCPEKSKFFLINTIYLLCLFQDKKALYFHLRKILNKKAKKLSFKYFLKILLRPTLYKKVFFKNLIKKNIINDKVVYKVFVFKKILNKKILKIFYRIRKNAYLHKQVKNSQYIKYFLKKRKELNL